MHKHASFAIMAAIFLTAVVTVTLYAVDRANAQGNETSTTGGEEHNMTSAAGGELQNMTNATTRTHVEVPPATQMPETASGGHNQ